MIFLFRHFQETRRDGVALIWSILSTTTWRKELARSSYPSFGSNSAAVTVRQFIPTVRNLRQRDWQPEMTTGYNARVARRDPYRLLLDQ